MTLNIELDRWQPAGHAVRIEYARTVTDEIRIAVTDGFNRVPHGGVEIGGVLFGVRQEDTITIMAHRELPCEYAYGPSFTLSDSDRNALTELLCAPATDPDLRSMQPVGWYHSHTRSEILLTDQDLKLYNQFFPKSWQIALVLRPHRFDPMRAGFFFREQDGSVRADSTHLEFLIQPVSRKPHMPSHLEAPEAAPTPDAAIRDAAIAEADHVQDEAAWMFAPPRSVEEQPQISDPPQAVQGTPPSREARPFWRVPATVWMLAAVLAVVALGIGKFRTTKDVSLHAVDVNGQLRIDWDRGARAIQRSSGAELEIQDGPIKLHDELTREHLMAGNITYLRTTGHVVVRLILRGADGSAVTEVTRFLGPPVIAAVPAALVSPELIVSAAPLEEDKGSKQAAPPPRREQAARESKKPLQAGTGAERFQAADRREFTPPAAPRRWVAPPAAAPSRPAELPAPPAVAVNSPAGTASEVPRIPVPVPSRPVEHGPVSGTLIWTGKLARGGTLQIQGNHASQGHVTGALPASPVRLRVFSTELTQSGLKVFTDDAKSVGATEAPGAQNGWMRTTWVLNEKKAGEVRIVEAPGQANGWNRLTLRAERGEHAVIVLHWNRLEAGQ